MYVGTKEDEAGFGKILFFLNKIISSKGSSSKKKKSFDSYSNAQCMCVCMCVPVCVPVAWVLKTEEVWTQSSTIFKEFISATYKMDTGRCRIF